MKRLGTSLAAAALTGAIAFAGIPASASEGAVPQETTTLGDRGVNENNNDGDNGENEGDRERERERERVKEGETPYDGGSNSRVECADDANAELNIKWDGEFPESFESEGATWFKHEDGQYYVTDSANLEGELTEQDKFESDQAAAKKFGYTCDYEGSDGDREGEGGGEGDRERERERERTPGNENNREDCETPNNGGGTNEGNGENCETTTLGDRGINAETGDNTVARVLAALAAISALGAAAFAARRFLTA